MVTFHQKDLQVRHQSDMCAECVQYRIFCRSISGESLIKEALEQWDREKGHSQDFAQYLRLQFMRNVALASSIDNPIQCAIGLMNLDDHILGLA